MPIIRWKSQSNSYSFEDYFKMVHQKEMLYLLDRINQHFTTTEVYAFTSVYYLVIIPSNILDFKTFIRLHYKNKKITVIYSDISSDITLNKVEEFDNFEEGFKYLINLMASKFGIV